MKFHIVHDGLVVCVHPEGEYQVPEIPGQTVDLICHLIPGKRILHYVPMILSAPELLIVCNDLYHLCLNQLDFPANSLALIRARKVMEMANDFSACRGDWQGSIDFPPPLSFIPDHSSTCV